VDLESELVRSYPDPEFARPVLGRPGADGRPAGGIERVLDSLLVGVPGAAVVLRDGRGRVYESPSRLEAFPVPGHDVVLTLDAALQEIVEAALPDAIARLDAAGGDVVVVDPHTGEVLALASRRAGGAATSGAITMVFEPGSTAKIFAAAALIEGGLVSPTDSVYGEGGRWVLPHRVLDEDHEHDFVWMTLAQAVQVSSNIGTVKFASRLDRAAQFGMLRAFGFGSPTGIEYPTESPGLLWRPTQWSGTTAQALAIGYEVAVTPLQLAMAYGAIANDGILLRATLVKTIRDPRGRTIYQHRPEPIRRVVRPEVAAALREMLLGVVTRGGTGAAAALSTYALAGKTGTARVAGPGGYVPGAHTAVFAALFPADDPQLAMVVKLDSPRGSYAALTAAPLTRRVLEQLLAARTGALDRARLTLAVAPPRPAAPGAREETAVARFAFAWPDPDTASRARGGRVPDVLGLGLREAVSHLHRDGLHVRVEGRGQVVRTTPAPGDSVGAQRVVTLFAEPRP
jgi:cell division protein FtsI (penicillin-binding protein 3)